MERHQCHLEAKSNYDEEQSHQRCRAEVGQGGCGDVYEMCGSCHAVKRREAEEHERRGNGAEDEVLHCRFQVLLASIKGRQGIGGQAGQLEAHEQGDDVNGAGDNHHAHGGKEQRCVKLVCTLSRIPGQGGYHYQ